jgi:hypothetical protein
MSDGSQAHPPPLAGLVEQSAMTLLDQVKQQLRPAAAILGLAASRVVERLRDLIRLRNQVARSSCRHTSV